MSETGDDSIFAPSCTTMCVSWSLELREERHCAAITRWWWRGRRQRIHEQDIKGFGFPLPLLLLLFLPTLLLRYCALLHLYDYDKWHDLRRDTHRPTPQRVCIIYISPGNKSCRAILLQGLFVLLPYWRDAREDSGLGTWRVVPVLLKTRLRALAPLNRTFWSVFQTWAVR